MQGGDRIVDRLSFAWSSMAREQRADLLLRLYPRSQSRLATTRTSERPQQRDRLVESPQTSRAVHAELGHSVDERVGRKPVADLDNETVPTQQSAYCRLAATELRRCQWPLTR